MKRIKKGIIYSIILLTALIYISCEEGDNEKEWGMSKIYMPQASILDGGNTKNYPVPLNNGINNYILDTVNNTIDIPLGVYRSGLEVLNSYSVKIGAYIDTTDQIISAGTISKAILLPSELYSIPTDITVPNGEREAIFYLTIDRKKLIENYPQYYKNKLVIVIGISDPSKYELNKSLSKTTVIVDGTFFMPTPPVQNLVEGSDMEASSKQFWTIIPQSSGETGVRADISFSGVLTWKNGSGNVISNDIIYQPLQLTEGKNYKFSADVTSSGATNSWYEVHIGTTPPVAEGDYADDLFLALDTWTAGCFNSPQSGNLVDLACKGPGIENEGIYTSTTTGTVYFIIKAGSWDGNIGTVTIDNISITEVP